VERVMLMASLLRCDRVNVVRNGRALLRDVALAVAPGERVALVGANGAGKSTLLRVASGEIRPDSGSVLLRDRPIAAWRDADRARLRFVLPQSAHVPFAFTAQEIVELGRFPHCAGALRAHDRDIVRDALALLDASDLSPRDVTTLSGGERARVHCARVLAQAWDASPANPGLLLLDEPTAALDLKHQGLLLSRVSAFAQSRGVGVLAVLHDINLVSQWADRIVWLRSGEIVADGSPRATVNRELLRRVFEVNADVHEAPGGERPRVSVALC